MNTLNDHSNLVRRDIAASTGSTLVRRLDGWLGALVEASAALLVLVEITLLFAGIVARYLLHTPLTWSDELASVLFLWLAMLGSVVALRRGEHMRMTTFVNRASPKRRAFLEAFAMGVTMVFLVMILHPSYEFLVDEQAMNMPGMDISAAWRAAEIGRAHV